MYRLLTRTAIFGCGLLLTGHELGAQTEGLAITSPASGTVVQAGQVFNVSVRRGALGNMPIAIGIFGSWSDIETGTNDPLAFTIPIPDSLTPGKYPVTAIVASGQNIAPAPSVFIDIESPLAFVRLGSTLPRVLMNYIGSSKSIGIVGVPSSGPAVTLTDSSRISLVSSNPNIVAIDPAGKVTAMSSGSTEILVKYENPNHSSVSLTIPVSVPSLLKGDLNGDGQIDTDDIQIIENAINTPAVVPNDARDLNHDGVINALDARVLTTLCTYSHCATHP